MRLPQYADYTNTAFLAGVTKIICVIILTKNYE